MADDETGEYEDKENEEMKQALKDAAVAAVEAQRKSADEARLKKEDRWAYLRKEGLVKCRNCTYRDEAGLCHIAMPAVRWDGDKCIGGWPRVEDDDWCCYFRGTFE